MLELRVHLRAASGLRQQDHISEAQCRNDEVIAAVAAGGHKSSRGRAIGLEDGGLEALWQAGEPLLVVLGGQKEDAGLLRQALQFARLDFTDIAPARLHEFQQLGGAGRIIAYSVASGAKGGEETDQTLGDIEAGGGEIGFAHAVEVHNGDTLVGIGFAAQVDPALGTIHQPLDSLLDGSFHPPALLIPFQTFNQRRLDGAVQLRDHCADGQPRSTDAVSGLPVFLYGLLLEHERQTSEDGRIDPAGEEFDSAFTVPEAAVRAVDDQIGSNFF